MKCSSRRPNPHRVQERVSLISKNECSFYALLFSGIFTDAVNKKVG